MAPAMQTTKRKFYKLLDGLNTSSSSISRPKTAASATTVNEEPATKKTRLSVDSNQSISSTRPRSVRVIGIDALSTKSSVRPKSPNGKSVPRPTPNYQPYSQDAFLDRLKTFSDVKVWTYKPSEISELEWAKRGWVCEGNKVDVVACKGGCEVRVPVRLARGRERAKAFGEAEATDEDPVDAGSESNGAKSPADVEPDWMADADGTLVRKYQELIVDGHRDDCLWRKAGCKDDIYRIRMGDFASWQKDLRERYFSLKSIESALPERLKSPETRTQDQPHEPFFDIDEIKSTLQDLIFSSPTSSHKETPASSRDEDDPAPAKRELHLTAATLAIFGWQGSSPHKIHLATCTRCFQRIGLWVYSSNPSTKALPATESGIADDDILRFDLVGLHRDHCPWTNAETQAGLGQFKNLPAWEILVRLIKARHAIGEGMRAQSAVSDGSDSLRGSSDGQQRSYEDTEAEDRARGSKLAKLRRAFTINKDKRKSWKSAKSATQ